MLIDPKKLRAIRRTNGWTQEDLAQMMDVNVRSVQRGEATGRMSSDAISALCAVIGKDRSEMLVPEPEEAPPMSRVPRQSIRLAIIALVFAIGIMTGLGVAALM